MQITAAVLRESGLPTPYASSLPLSLERLELGELGPSEVLVRTEAAGVCHSDLGVVDGKRPRPLPMALGHEAAGIVEGVGGAVTDLATGDRVVTVFLPRCEECEECATGGRLPCSRGTRTNTEGVLPSGSRRLRTPAGEEVGHHLGVSAFASHMVVDRRSVVPVAADVSPAVAALLGCAVLTGGGAVKNASGLVPGQDVIVVGLGGVGMAALLTAVALTAPAGGKVYGVDANPDKHRHALDLGATKTFLPEAAVQAGLRAPIVIEAAGHPRAFETAVDLTAPGGTTVTVGLPAPGATATIMPLGITAEARRIVGCYLGSAVPAQDIPFYAELWRSGRLPVEKLVSTTIPLGDINAALDELRGGSAIRQVIDFVRYPVGAQG